ncbi:MAG: fluoride efflux transporter CrcB [Pseudomonadales bacterium]
MGTVIAIALGGALGALARHGLTSWVTQRIESHFPWATLSVNLLGSIGIGVLYVLIVKQSALAPEIRNMAMVGFLGAFTTFSTFSLEFVVLMQDGRLLAAMSYIGSSVMPCCLGAWSGMSLPRLW